MNWLYEAGSALDKLKENGFPAGNQKQYDRIYADYLIKSGQYEASIPYLQKAIRSEKNKRQRARMRYLLGQLYAGLGQKEEAFRTFKKVAASNPPYELEFAARIRQTEVVSGKSRQSVLKMLRRMAKSDKNKDYLDQVYYAIGNIYMSVPDTTKAIESYALGIEESTQNGLDKAICQIRLGDIYFTQKDYVKAQPCFSGALSGIRKEYKEYERISRLSAVLDELVVHVEAIHLQDSLQTLAKMPESERLAVIDKIIEDVKKKEEEEAKNAAREQFLADQESRGGLDRPSLQQGNVPTIAVPGGESSFYFYNTQTVAQGKTQFQNKWGKRPLEDNWRRRNKTMNIVDPLANEEVEDANAMQFDENGNPVEQPSDSLQLLMDSLSSDPKAREYYLQQIPFSEEDMEASDIIIADGLFNMGMIYKDKLEDLHLSLDAFEELDRRFPDNKYRMDAYFQVYLMALRYKDQALGDKYKAMLINAFPESDYAIAIADPNYEDNIRRMDIVQDSLYETTYEQYLSGDTSSVRQNYRMFSETFPLSKLMPKYMFLNALTYVQAGDAEGFKAALTALVEKYPRADVTELASEMLKGLLRGRALMQGDVTGMTWNLRFGVGEDGMLSAADSARVFTDEPDSPHRMLLIFPTGSIDKNQLLYIVAAFNFASFTVHTFDLNIDDVGSLSILTIRPFATLNEALDYERMVYSLEGYGQAIDRVVSFFPFSENNYETLMHGKTLDEYMSFFAEHYGEKAPELIARWRVRMENEDEPADMEDAAVEKAAGIEPDSLSEQEEMIEKEIIPEDEQLNVQAPEVQIDSLVNLIDTIQMPITGEQPVVLPDDEQPLSADSVTPPARPKEITLEQLEERRKQAELEAQAKEEEAQKAAEQRKKEAADQKKQKEKLRKQAQKQKQKEARERQKQKEKERKEKERANKKRQQEKQAQKKAERKAKK